MAGRSELFLFIGFPGPGEFVLLFSGLGAWQILCPPLKTRGNQEVEWALTRETTGISSGAWQRSVDGSFVHCRLVGLMSENSLNLDRYYLAPPGRPMPPPIHPGSRPGRSPGREGLPRPPVPKNLEHMAALWLGYNILEFFKDCKSVIFGVWAASGAPETLAKGGGLHPRVCEGSPRPPGPPRTQK